MARRDPPFEDAEQVECSGAGNGIRTRDPNLGKVVLYQLSYSRPEGYNTQLPGVCQPVESRHIISYK